MYREPLLGCTLTFCCGVVAQGVSVQLHARTCSGLAADHLLQIADSPCPEFSSDTIFSQPSVGGVAKYTGMQLFITRAVPGCYAFTHTFFGTYKRDASTTCGRSTAARHMSSHHTSSCHPPAGFAPFDPYQGAIIARPLTRRFYVVPPVKDIEIVVAPSPVVARGALFDTPPVVRLVPRSGNYSSGPASSCTMELFGNNICPARTYLPARWVTC